MELTRRELLQSCAFAVAGFGLVPITTFERIMAQAHQGRWARLPMGELVGRCGLALVGTPYVGNTLEVADTQEECVVDLDRLDCVTFYEAALGLARLIRKGGRTFPQLMREVESMRYRSGHAGRYLDRLHYTSDWFAVNAARGLVRDLTRALPWTAHMDKRLDFMSTHPELYRQLKAHPEWVPEMARLEREAAARYPLYLPNEFVASAERFLQTGDIVGVATSAVGLDCSHTGLVYVDPAGVRRFLNASSVKHEVVLGERLSDYALKYKRNIGIMVVRPL